MPGAVLGVAAGLLLSGIWLFGDWNVALAVTFVFVGLVTVLLFGSPGWRPFATGLLAAAVVAAGLLVLIVS